MSNRNARVALILGHQWGDRSPESYQKQAQGYCKHMERCSNEHITYYPEVFSGENSNTEAFDWVRQSSDAGAIVFLSRSALGDAEEMLKKLMLARLHKKIRVWVFTGLLFKDRVNVLDIGMYDPEGWTHIVD